MKLSFAYLVILLYFCHPYREEVLRWPTASSTIGRKKMSYNFSSVRVIRVKLCQQLKLKRSDKITAFVVQFSYAETHSFKIGCKSTHLFR